MFFCDDNLSKERFKCVEYSRTFQIASRLLSTDLIFGVINYYYYYYPHGLIFHAVDLSESRATPGKTSSESALNTSNRFS